MNPGFFLLNITVLAFAGLQTFPLAAATVGLPVADQAPQGRGAPLHQRFLESGASVVTTTGHRYCAVSRRIDIAASSYADAGGRPVPFSEVIRSPASSVQALSDPAGLMGFRVQLKYSPDPGRGIVLTIGEASVDVAGLLEPSTDSLYVDGELAMRLASAFRDGAPVHLSAISRATGRQVGDILAAPDLAALDACKDGLPALSETPLPPLSSQVSLDFDVTRDPKNLAMPEDYRTCGMKETDTPLYLGRIRSTTGFFTHTDKIFVSFDSRGRLDRVYVPGLMDGGFAGGSSGEVRVSQSADGNLPDSQNKVTGCIGAAAQRLCHIPQIGGTGHRLQVCDALPAEDVLGEQIAGFDPLPMANGLPLPAGMGTLSSRGPGSGAALMMTAAGVGAGTPATGGGGATDPGGGVVPPSPVPVPAAGLMLLAAVGGLAALRRRKA